MILPKPVVLAGLLIAYCLGQFITWFEQTANRHNASSRSGSDVDKVIVNERLA